MKNYLNIAASKLTISIRNFQKAHICKKKKKKKEAKKRIGLTKTCVKV